MSSILLDIRKMIGPSETYEHFDTDLIIHINSAFMILKQLGVGPEKGFRITGDTEQWSDFVPDEDYLDLVKTYVYLRVRLAFDPPQHGALLESIQNQIREAEWRLNVAVDPGEEES